MSEHEAGLWLAAAVLGSYVVGVAVIALIYRR